MFCEVIVVTKCTMSIPGSLLIFCTAQQQHILVLTTKLHICAACCSDSQMEFNCVVRKVYLAIIGKLSQNRVVQLEENGC